MTTARTSCFARHKAAPGTHAGFYVERDIDGVLVSMTDGEQAMQMVLTPDEAKALAAMMYRLATEHSEPPPTSN